MVKPISTKNTQISWLQWHTPVAPAMWETEGGSLEPGKQTLQQAEITLLHSNLGDKVRLHLKNKQNFKKLLKDTIFLLPGEI